MKLYFKEVGWVLGKRIEYNFRQEGVKKRHKFALKSTLFPSTSVAIKTSPTPYKRMHISKFQRKAEKNEDILPKVKSNMYLGICCIL